MQAMAAQEQPGRADELTGWFEPLYAAAEGDPGRIPWAHDGLHTGLKLWLDAVPDDDLLHGAGRPALVVGTGLGDDAVELSRRRWNVTAFDVAPSAIAAARERHPDARVRWHVADLFALPPEWRRAFDFVLEVFTVQSLPPHAHLDAVSTIADLVAPDGTALVVATLRPDGPPPPGPPWPLTEDELGLFAGAGGLTAGRRLGGTSLRGLPLAVVEYRRDG